MMMHLCRSSSRSTGNSSRRSRICSGLEGLWLFESSTDSSTTPTSLPAVQQIGRVTVKVIHTCACEPNTQSSLWPFQKLTLHNWKAVDSNMNFYGYTSRHRREKPHFRNRLYTAGKLLVNSENSSVIFSRLHISHAQRKPHAKLMEHSTNGVQHDLHVCTLLAGC